MELPSGYWENKKHFNPNSPQSSPWQTQTSLQGPIAILWDIENCPVPNDVRPEDIAGNIRMALRVHPVVVGPVTMFSAYGDFNAFPRRLREGCQRTGVKLVDVPNGRKDAADKAILIDMFLFALDNRPPSSILLISGDVDFAPALHILGQRGYNIIVVIPSRVGVSSTLCSAGRFLWDWSSVARGEGFVPQAKISVPCAPCCTTKDCSNDEEEQEQEEAIVYRGVSKKHSSTQDCSTLSESIPERNDNPKKKHSSTQDCSTMSESIPERNDNPTKQYSSTQDCSTKSESIPERNDNPVTMRSQSCPNGKVSAGPVGSSDKNDSTGGQQGGDINVLKGQLVKLLELSGGDLLLSRLPGEYHKMYGKCLCLSEYGVRKLIRLLEKMDDLMMIKWKEKARVVCLGSSKSQPDTPPGIFVKKTTKKNVDSSEDDLDVATGSRSSEEEKVVVEERGDKERNMIDQFKNELRDILRTYSSKIVYYWFEAIYKQRFKKPLDYPSYGVGDLEELLAKVSDVAVLKEEPVSKRKFLVSVGG